MHPSDPGYSPSYLSSPASSAMRMMAMIRIGVIVLFMFGMLAAVVLFLSRPEDAEPEAWRRATLILLEDPQMKVLQHFGPPACEREEDEIAIWLYSVDGGERPECRPRAGDFQVMIGDGKVVGYDPEYELRTPVRTDVDQMRFRRTVGADRPQEETLF